MARGSQHGGLCCKQRRLLRPSPQLLAQEIVKEGILVNAVAPSIIDTLANRKDMPDADHASWPKADEVAATILFLASPENKVTSGVVVPVFGRV